MSFLVFVLTIVSLIATWQMISAAFRLGHRIAHATEQSQYLLQTIYDSMSDETKERAREIRERRNQEVVERIAINRKATPLSNALWPIGLFVAGFVFLAIVTIVGVRSDEQTRVYAPDGRSVGTIAPQGQGSVRYYDARGNSLGTSTTTGNTTRFYDAGGRPTGSATSPGSLAFPRR
jgi:YD repeat-containing protein